MTLDIAAAREGFKEKVTSDIECFRSSHNISDEFTKETFQAALQYAIKNGFLRI